jgi:hypothetical protein
MNYRIHYALNKHFPKLGWLACLDQESGLISVVYGSSVEYRDGWMVEGVWDDDFELGNFHRRENFFGSGFRVETNAVYFVSSTALTDRLLYCEENGRFLCSNSLILLLAATGATLDDNHDYHREALSIMRKGIKKYDRRFAIIHPRINCFYQVFHENIVLSNGHVAFQRRSRRHRIDSFDQYYGLLKEILTRIKQNYESKARKIPLAEFTTLSSGYDSTAVSCLARSLGVKTCFTGNALERRLRFMKRNRDNGTSIAKSLGLEIKYLDSRHASVSEDELYFLATNYPKFSHSVWSELSLHSMTSYIERNCSAALLFTGYHGGLIWDVNAEDKYVTDELKKYGALSGLNLTEIRLKSGFIQVAVPYILARDIEDILRVSRSRDMEPWRLNNSYDKPIPRRIAEESGVNRRLFGREKYHITQTYLWPRNPRLRKQFFEYLKENYGVGPVFRFIYYILNIVASPLMRHKFFWKNFDFYYLMSHWATNLLAERMAEIFAKDKAFESFKK